MRAYIVILKNNSDEHWYCVDAPSKRVARWCALNMFQHEYCGPELKLRDFKVYAVKSKAAKNVIKGLGI